MPDQSPFVLFHACPVGAWPAATVLTALAVVDPTGLFAAAIAAEMIEGFELLIAGTVTVVLYGALACAFLALAFIGILVLLVVLFGTLAWMRDD